LQPHIDRILPGSLSLYESADKQTLKQRLAVDWSFAISNCLRREMALHPRCGACAILMGPGHTEAGIQGFCGTHSVSAAARPAARPAALSDAKTDSLSWLAGNVTQAMQT
jgi:hypothetical protein